MLLSTKNLERSNARQPLPSDDLIQILRSPCPSISCAHPLPLVSCLQHLLARSLAHSLTHSPTRSLAHSLTRSLTHSLAHSLAHSHTHSLTRSLHPLPPSPSLPHRLLIKSSSLKLTMTSFHS